MSKAKVMRALKFLRVVDSEGNLSLTNLALVAVSWNVLQRPEINLQDLLAFVGAMVGYHVKRFAAAPVTPEQDSADLRAEIDSLKTKITALGFQQSLPRR